MTQATSKLKVFVPLLAPVSHGELIVRLHQRLRALATTRDRAPGEPISLGDDLCLTLTAGCDGALIPFSTRFEWWVPALPLPELPGFIEGLLGERVGTTVKLTMPLPSTYVVEALRGRQARFVVELCSAREVTDLPESEFRRLGLGSTLKHVMGALHLELEAERQAAQEHLARELTFDAVLAAAKLFIPKALIDDDLRRSWERVEGHLLRAHAFSQAELDESLNGWLTDGPTRVAAERRVALTLIFRSVAQQEGRGIYEQDNL